MSNSFVWDGVLDTILNECENGGQCLNGKFFEEYMALIRTVTS
jgi:hypothetical protein